MIYRSTFGFPGWNLRNTFEELNRMRRQMDRLFEDFPTEGVAGYRSGVFPAMNLTEDREQFYLRAELAAIEAGDFSIEVTGKNLSISGERKIPVEEGAKYHRREREPGRFSRVVNLPGDVESDKVSASLKNGILTVILPKAAASKPRQITIN